MFAIDFGARSIKVLKLNKIVDGYELESFGATFSPEGAIANGEIINPIAVADALADLLSKIRMRDNRAIIAITGQKLIIREIILPLMEEKEILPGVLWEAPKYVPYNLDEAVIDAEKIEEFTEKDGNQMMKVLLVAVPKSVIQPYMDVLKKVRIIPKIVDISSAANIRAFDFYLNKRKNELKEKVQEEKEKQNIETVTEAILSIGASTTILTLAEKGNLKFARDILIGGNDITKAIAKSLNITFSEAEKLKREIKLINLPEGSPSEEKTGEAEKIMLKILDQLAKEVRKSLNYYKTQNQQVKYSRIILCGGSANINGIEEFLTNEFEITTKVGDPWRGISIDEGEFDLKRLNKIKSTLATVIGLAKRER